MPREDATCVQGPQPLSFLKAATCRYVRARGDHGIKATAVCHAAGSGSLGWQTTATGSEHVKTSPSAIGADAARPQGVGPAARAFDGSDFQGDRSAHRPPGEDQVMPMMQRRSPYAPPVADVP